MVTALDTYPCVQITKCTHVYTIQHFRDSRTCTKYNIKWPVKMSWHIELETLQLARCWWDDYKNIGQTYASKRSAATPYKCSLLAYSFNYMFVSVFACCKHPSIAPSKQVRDIFPV